jgi:hypothetical protein
LFESNARGAVNVAIAPARGRFRPLGRSLIRRGTFVVNFVQRTPGVYRLRFRHAGNALMRGGQVVRPITITRRSFFR